MGWIHFVFAGVLCAAIAPLLVRVAPRYGGLVLALWPTAAAIYGMVFIEPVLAGQSVMQTVPWVPSLGLSLTFVVDGLSLLFLLMVTLVGAVVLVYGAAYLHGHPQMGRFYMVLLLFMTAMMGTVLSGNLLSLFVFWEVTGIASYVLIGFNHESESSRKSALQALLITTAGGLAMLAGVLMLGHVGQSFSMSELAQRANSIQSHPWYGAIFTLILVGAWAKSAQFPLHFWLPQAMAAPTPISAYLHSATMVKLGVFLLARLYPVLGGTETWQVVLVGLGGITMVMGACRSPWQTDLKAVLAYSTLSILGMLIFCLGLGGVYGLTAMAVVTMAHTLYKAPLFLVAGNLDHQAGTRDTEKLRGLRERMPMTFAVGCLAAAAMVGLPFTLGAFGKKFWLQAFHESGLPIHSVWLLVLVSGGLMVAAWVAGVKPFLGPSQKSHNAVREAPIAMWLGPLLLTLLGICLTVFWPDHTAAFSLQTAAAIKGHGLLLDPFGQVAGLSAAKSWGLIGLFLGALLIVLRPAIRGVLAKWRLPDALRPSHLYQQAFEGVLAFAPRLTNAIQSPLLRENLTVILWVFVVLVGFTLYRLGGLPSWPQWQPQVLEIGLALLLLAAAMGALRAGSMMNAAVFLGLVGFAVSAVFLLYGAVDLAITQIVVDTLTVLLFVFVVHKLPKVEVLSSAGTRLRDALLAGAAGLCLTLVIWKADQVLVHPSISQFYNDHAVPKGHGQNIVNVILVDFRALDTLGEITVLAVAAMGVFLLVNRKLRDPKKAAEKLPTRVGEDAV